MEVFGRLPGLYGSDFATRDEGMCGIGELILSLSSCLCIGCARGPPLASFIVLPPGSLTLFWDESQPFFARFPLDLAFGGNPSVSSRCSAVPLELDGMASH